MVGIFSPLPVLDIHLRLSIAMMLRGIANAFGCHFGIKCSSFCRVNVGTSMRSACTSVGYCSYESVRLSNKLLERTIEEEVGWDMGKSDCSFLCVDQGLDVHVVIL